MTLYLWPLFAVYWYISTEIMENFLHNNYVPFKDIVMDSFVGLNFKYFLKSYCQTYWAPILIMWGSWTLIFIIWVFSHSSVDYTVTYSIKKKGWLIRYIDLQLEPNIYFSEFSRRSITSNLNNGCRWPRRVEEAEEGDKRLGWSKYDQQQHCMISTVYDQQLLCATRQCMIKQWGWSDLPHCWNGMIGTKYLLADCQKRVKGCVWTIQSLLQNRQRHIIQNQCW